MVIVATLVIFVGLSVRNPQADYKVLYSGLSQEDAASVINRLKEMRVPYSLANEGSVIKVPPDVVHETRLTLAGEGLPRGGGVGLISACDIALAERGATFRLSEVRLGIIPAMISPYVIAAMGERMAHRYMLSGEELDAAEAYRIGLVHDICEEPELNAQVGRMLAQLHSSGPRAVVAIKKLIPEIAAAAIDDAVSEKTAQRIAELRTTPEAQEGLGAFLEKRKPSWTAAAPDKSGKETNRHDAGKNKNRN